MMITMSMEKQHHFFLFYQKIFESTCNEWKFWLQNCCLLVCFFFGFKNSSVCNGILIDAKSLTIQIEITFFFLFIDPIKTFVSFHHFIHSFIHIQTLHCCCYIHHVCSSYSLESIDYLYVCVCLVSSRWLCNTIIIIIIIIRFMNESKRERKK